LLLSGNSPANLKPPLDSVDGRTVRASVAPKHREWHAARVARLAQTLGTDLLTTLRSEGRECSNDTIALAAIDRLAADERNAAQN
jgi:hypothetical protein